MEIIAVVAISGLLLFFIVGKFVRVLHKDSATIERIRHRIKASPDAPVRCELSENDPMPVYVHFDNGDHYTLNLHRMQAVANFEEVRRRAPQCTCYATCNGVRIDPARQILSLWQ